MNYLDRITQFRDKIEKVDKKLALTLEQEFPEIVDNAPYIYGNDLLMRLNYGSTVYQLVYVPVEHGDRIDRFKIKSVTDNRFWTKSKKPTNHDMLHDNRKDNRYYLNKRDFEALLKGSGVKIESVKIIHSRNIRDLHRTLFNN